MAEQMGLIDFAKQRGIPEAKARQCLADMTQIDRWTKQTQDKSADGTVSGTPTLLINGKKVDAVTWGQLEQLLKAAGA
jgi:protein-disulfide isomerase